MSGSLQRLQELGQSPWLDFITRDLLRSGRLATMVRAGEVTGLTSNPTIFERAISTGTEYDDAFGALVRNGKSPTAIIDALMVEDIRGAADVFRPVYERTKRADGYVSIEIDPTLAHDTAGTIREVRRTWRAVNRPNLMVKIPATLEGIPAIEDAIATGINVNVTLIFSIARYELVIDAHLRGLTRRLEAGTRVDRIASVASFFVSRIDTAVDRLLEARGAPEHLRGQAAIANAKLAYAVFRQRFGADRFALLAREGARPQRPLWASTSSKNPAYPDVYYVEALVGADTVNTLPPATLAAYSDHGHPEPRIDTDLDQAGEVPRQLRAVGIDLGVVTRQLEVEGVNAFVASYRSLVDTVTARREAVLALQRTAEDLGPMGRAVETAFRQLDAASVGARLWSKDATLWGTDGPAAEGDVVDRMGWLDLPKTMSPRLAELGAFAEEVRAAGFTHALLCGMGGSSVAATVLRHSLGVRRGYLDLTVLDSTDPAALLAAEQRSDPAHTLYLVSSKSGDTIEVQAFLAFFWDRLSRLVGNHAPAHFVAITDPGTPLEQLARERQFRRVFLNPPDIAGRYAALSLVGLVPAALMGHDVEKLVGRARRMLLACTPSVRASRNPGLRLGAVLATAARSGRNKLTLIVADKIVGFADWAEQLVAESIGKHERGIVPVVGEPQAPPAAYGKDRAFVSLRVGTGGGRPLAGHARAGHPVVSLRLNDAYDLAAEFVRWEIAVAVAGHLLEVNPFDQPNLQETKANTARFLAEPGRRIGAGDVVSVDAPELGGVVWGFLARATTRSYVVLAPFFASSARRTKLLTEARERLRRHLGTATTLGYGPRFLHMTGQLHKGGPTGVLVLQLTADDPVDIPVPGAAYSFGALKSAQAAGDSEALVARGRRVLRVHLGRNVERGLELLVASLARRPAARPATGRRATTATVRARAGRRP